MMQRDLENSDFQQQELLKGLLAKNKDTECGTDRGYASILADPDPVGACILAGSFRLPPLHDCADAQGA